MISRRATIAFLLSCLSPFGAASSIRKSYRESCLLLQKIGLIEKGAIPPMPKHLPRYDNPQPLGVNFFRTQVEKADLSNLSLPRTFFGRSEIKEVSFKNSDLSESNLCWNDFIEVNFSGAILAKSDLRASIYENVRFDQANLSKADLRRSSFKGCSFAGANMSGALATRKQQAELNLSKEQYAQISWATHEGQEPDGG